MRKKLTLYAALLSFVGSFCVTVLMPVDANAARAGNYIGCVSKESLHQYNNALVTGDTRLSNLMLASECMLVGGMEFSVLDGGFVTSKAKFYKGSESIDLWVPSEAVH